MGSLAYGVYLGSDLNSQNSIRTGGNSHAGSSVAVGNSGLLARDNELDLFLAGDMGVEWGVRLGYASASAESATAGGPERENSGLNIGGGVMLGDIDVYANLTLSDESKNTDTSSDVKWEGSGLEVGAGYAMQDLNFFFNYRTQGGEYTPGGGVAKNETSQNTITLGVGRMKKMSSSSMVFFDVRYVSQSAEDKDGATANNTVERNTTSLPLTAGFEADATSWLTLRGSITQNVFLNTTENKESGRTYERTTANTTDVEAGATLNFGKLKIDGVIGNSGHDGDSSTGTESGVLALDRLMGRVAVHYWF